MNRLGHRYVCPACGSVSSLSADTASGARTCARDGAALEQRSDDLPEIIAHRIDVFLLQTAPLIDYYRGQGRLVLIDADRPPDEVHASMLQALASTSTVASVA